MHCKMLACQHIFSSYIYNRQNHCVCPPDTRKRLHHGIVPAPDVGLTQCHLHYPQAWIEMTFLRKSAERENACVVGTKICYKHFDDACCNKYCALLCQAGTAPRRRRKALLPIKGLPLGLVFIKLCNMAEVKAVDTKERTIYVHTLILTCYLAFLGLEESENQTEDISFSSPPVAASIHTSYAWCLNVA